MASPFPPLRTIFFFLLLFPVLCYPIFSFYCSRPPFRLDSGHVPINRISKPRQISYPDFGAGSEWASNATVTAVDLLERLQAHEASASQVPYSLYELNVDPSRRDLGLPLTLDSWPWQQVFVITNKVAEGHVHTSFKVLDSLLFAAGLSYTRAVAPKTLSPWYEEVWPSYRGEEGGTAFDFSAAHVETWAAIVSSNIPYALVIECEADLPSYPYALRQQLEQGLRQLNFVMATSGEAGPAFDIVLITRKPSVPYGEAAPAPNIRVAGASEGGNAYIISERGAKRLLRGAFLHPDLPSLLWSAPGVVKLALEPPLGGMSSGHTCRQERCANENEDMTLLKGCKGTIFLGEEMKVEEGENRGVVARACGTKATCLILQHQEQTKQKKQHQGNAGKGLVLPLSTASPPPPPSLVALLPTRVDLFLTFMINMKNDMRRLNRMVPMLRTSGFGSVVRVLAVDMETADMSMFDNLVASNRLSKTRAAWKIQPKLTKGEVGCSLSHYLVWAEILRLRLPFALVLEDDLQLVPYFKDQFAAVAQEANLALLRPDGSLSFDVMLLGRIPIVSDGYQGRVSEHIRSSAMSWCSFAYVISLEGARKAVEAFFIDDPVDTFWWRVPRIVFWATEPQLASHVSGSNPGEFQSRTKEASNSNWRKRRK